MSVQRGGNEAFVRDCPKTAEGEANEEKRVEEDARDPCKDSGSSGESDSPCEPLSSVSGLLFHCGAEGGREASQTRGMDRRNGSQIVGGRERGRSGQAEGSKRREGKAGDT